MSFFKTLNNKTLMIQKVDCYKTLNNKMPKLQLCSIQNTILFMNNKGIPLPKCTPSGCNNIVVAKLGA